MCAADDLDLHPVQHVLGRIEPESFAIAEDRRMPSRCSGGLQAAAPANP
jgi:hypothetical protein